MNSLISRLLEKRGVKDIEELSPAEKTDIDRWESILGTGDISIDAMTGFCDNQLKLIEVQWRNLENSTTKNERLVLLHSVYSSLKEMIKSPNSERAVLEKYLRGLLQE